MAASRTRGKGRPPRDRGRRPPSGRETWRGTTKRFGLLVVLCAVYRCHLTQKKVGRWFVVGAVYRYGSVTSVLGAFRGIWSNLTVFSDMIITL